MSLKNFVEDRPIIFMILVNIISTFLPLPFFVVVRGISTEFAGRMVAQIIGIGIPLFFIWRLKWWADAGIITRMKEVWPLVFLVIGMLILPLIEGIDQMGASFFRLWFAAYLMTGIQEEFMDRGLSIRVFYKQGPVIAVTLSAVLFSVFHLTQLFLGESLGFVLVIIISSFTFGMLYGAVRIRVDNIWPLVLFHGLFDLFYILAFSENLAAEPNFLINNFLLFVPLFLFQVIVAIVLLYKTPEMRITITQSEQAEQ